MIQKINIGTDINVPKLIDTKALFQATSGGGKSYAMRKMIEELSKGGLHQIILDPEGEFYSLREKFDFAYISRDTPDIPLNMEYAEVLAEKILETNLSVIIDLYGLSADDRPKFVNRFLTTMNNVDKRLSHPLMMYLDEADMFCTEGRGNESTQAVANTCARGRKRGFGFAMATTRLAKVKKSAVAELGNIFIGWTAHHDDRERAGEMLGIPKSEYIKLKKLSPGEFYADGPAVGYELGVFKVARVQTTHPKSGAQMPSQPPTPNAIRKILAKLPDIPQEAAKELQTKTQLQEEITRLNGRIKQLQGTTQGPLGGATDKQELLLAQTKLKQVQVENEGLKKELRMRQVVFESLAASIKPFTGDFSPAPAPERLPPSPKAIQPAREPIAPRETDGELGRGPEKMLKYLAMLSGEKVSKVRLSILAGYALKGGTFRIYLKKLTDNSLAEADSEGVQITPVGMAAAGSFDYLPTDPASLIAYWLGKLEAGPAKMFTVLTNHYPKVLSKEILGNLSGYTFGGGTFRIYLKKLKDLLLVQETKAGVCVTPSLYQG